MCACVSIQNHWFTYNQRMSVESVTQAVSNLALQFGDDDAESGAMVSHASCVVTYRKIPLQCFDTYATLIYTTLMLH